MERNLSRRKDDRKGVYERKMETKKEWKERKANKKRQKKENRSKWKGSNIKEKIIGKK
jgi:hypothetical protein